MSTNETVLRQQIRTDWAWEQLVMTDRMYFPFAGVQKKPFNQARHHGAVEPESDQSGWQLTVAERMRPVSPLSSA